MKMKIKLEHGARIPTKADDGAAGYDLYAYGDYIIYPNEVVKVSCGISLEIPDVVVGLLLARSGLAVNKRIIPANCVGVIDPSYRGIVTAALFNVSDDVYKVNNGDRVAQLVFAPYYDFVFEVVDTLSETRRGSGGFGSTGIA